MPVTQQTDSGSLKRLKEIEALKKSIYVNPVLNPRSQFSNAPVSYGGEGTAFPTAGVGTLLDDNSGSTAEDIINSYQKLSKPTTNDSTGGTTGGSTGSSAGGEAVTPEVSSNVNYQPQIMNEAQNAYNANVAALNSAYNSRTSALGSGYGDTMSQLIEAYQRGRNEIQDDSKSLYQDAYINRRLGEKNLGQQLSAQGLSGGATETAIAGLQNQYGNTRNQIATNQSSNIADFEAKQNAYIANARNVYQQALADAEAEKANYMMSLNNNLSDQRINSYNFQNTMPNYGNLENTSIAPTASNAYSTANTTQMDSSLAANPAYSLKKSGASDTDVILQLFNEGYTQDQISEFLRQLL